MKWKAANIQLLKGIAKGCKPKDLIEQLSEDLLATFEKAKLLDPYDMYQHLMDYWAETMQDDTYLIAVDGWKAEVTRVLVKNSKDKAVDKGWTCDLVPKDLVVARYFAKEQEVTMTTLVSMIVKYGSKVSS